MAGAMNKLKDRISAFIVENFLFGKNKNFRDDTSLIDEGIIDSTGVLELVGFLEQEFSIVVEDEDLLPENLNSINNVVAYVERKL